VPGGDIASLEKQGDARYYLLEAYKHLKPILLAGDARQFKTLLQVSDKGEEGLFEGDSVTDKLMKSFLTQLAAHRVWSRASKIPSIPA
jgi:catalase